MTSIKCHRRRSETLPDCSLTQPQQSTDEKIYRLPLTFASVAMDNLK